MTGVVVQKLRHGARLTDDDAQTLAGAIREITSLDARAELIEEGSARNTASGRNRTSRPLASVDPPSAGSKGRSTATAPSAALERCRFRRGAGMRL